MPIKITTIKAWGAALKIPQADIDAAITNTEEVEVAIPAGVAVFNEADLTTRETSVKNAGISAGRDFVIKELKEKAGIDFSGKDPETFIAEYSKKVLADANIQESTKISTLNDTVKQLQTNLQTMQGTLTAKDAEVATSKINAQILTDTIHLKPDNLENDEWVDLIRKRNELVMENGVQVVKRDGKIVQDATTLVAIAPKEALIGYITERKIGKVEEKQSQQQQKGRGSDDKTFVPGSISNMTQFKDHLKSQSINPNGQQAQSLLAEITKANPNFDMNAAS